MKDLTRISQGIFRHLATWMEVDLEIRLEISVRGKSEYRDDKGARCQRERPWLKFDSHGFEVG